MYFSISIILDKYAELGLLYHVVGVLLAFGGISILFSIVAALFHIPTNNVQGCKFLHIPNNTCHFL